MWISLSFLTITEDVQYLLIVELKIKEGEWLIYWLKSVPPPEKLILTGALALIIFGSFLADAINFEYWYKSIICLFLFNKGKLLTSLSNCLNILWYSWFSKNYTKL